MRLQRTGTQQRHQQRPADQLQDVARRIDTYLDNHPNVRTVGYAGMRIDARRRTFTLYWKAFVPRDLRTLVRRTAADNHVKAAIKPSNYTRDELMTIARRVMAIPGVVAVGTMRGKQGLEVTIKPSANAARVRKYVGYEPAVLKYQRGLVAATAGG